MIRIYLIYVTTLILIFICQQRLYGQQSGWDISEKGYDSFRISKLIDIIEKNDTFRANSIVVIQDGKLVIEKYFNGYDRNWLAEIRSITKSVTSALCGTIVLDGKLSADEKLADLYNLKKVDHPDFRKELVSVRELLNMQSMLDGDDFDRNTPGNELFIAMQQEPIPYILGLPMTSGSKRWRYFGGGVLLLGDIMDKKTPRSLQQYARKALFKPLGIRHYKWTENPPYLLYTAGGLHIRTIDLVKIGQLYLNGGMWGDERIFSDEWVEESFREPVTTHSSQLGYSYLWWHTAFKPAGEKIQAWAALGNGGSAMFIIPDLNVVVAVTASEFGIFQQGAYTWKMVNDYILPSLHY